MKTKDLIKKGKRKAYNKGFTLIELIVTVAIIAIFSGVVLTFVTTGSNTYRSTSSSAKVQMETQETFDQIEELIIDVNRSMYYANGSGSSIGSEIKNDIKQDGAANSTSDKTFIVCNEYKQGDGTSQYICDVLDWDKDDETIYYSQREYKATSSSENSIQTFSADDEEETVSDGEKNVRDAQTKVNRSVLATGILDFRADVSKVESDKIVRFQLSTQNGSKEIQTLHSVSLRNTVKIKKPSDSFDDAQTSDVGITIINAPESLDAGSDYSLIYDLTGNGSIDPTTVTWTVVQNPENGSFPSADPTNGKLSITDTASGTITVKVGAYTDKGVWVESAPVTIRINAKATPAPTTTPEPTVTPEPTSTPVPTVTPIPTPKPTDGDIILGGNTDFNIVLAGKIKYYNSKAYSTYGFGLSINDWKIDNTQAKLEWYIKDPNSPVTVANVANLDPAADVFVNIPEDCQTGFILGARYSGITYSGNPISGYAEREFYVANGIEMEILDADHHLIPSGSDITAGKEYLIHIYMKVYDANGKLYALDVTPTNTNNTPTISVAQSKPPISAVETDDGVYWKFMPVGDGKLTIEESLNKLNKNSCGIYGEAYNSNKSFITSVELNVVYPKLTAEIIGPDTVTQGENPEYYLELKDENGNEIDRWVTWSGDGLNISNWSTGTGADNKTKVSFYNNSLGKYTIKATYHATSVKNQWNPVETITKTFEVIKSN